MILTNVWAGEPLKVGVITDLHLLSSKLQDNGVAVNNYCNRTGKNIVATPEVMRESLALIATNDMDVLLFPGDLTSDGEKESHLQLQQNLKALKNKGVKIFVIPGNHDVNNPAARRFEGDKTFAVESITPEDFAEIYGDFGYKDAMSRDSASLSYISPLNDSVWVMGIDVAQYSNRASDRNIGKMKPETQEWVLKWAKEAKKQNKQLLPMMHWSLLEHIPFQKLAFPSYVLNNPDSIRNELADAGVKFIFTGHFHANDIKKHVSPQNNKIYDIATGATISYPYSIRLIELGNNKMDIKTKYINSTSSYPNLRENSEKVIKKIAKTASIPYIRRLGVELSPEEIEILSSIAGDYFASVMNGDANIVNSDIELIQKLLLKVSFPLPPAMKDAMFQKEIPNNNVTIYLDK